MSCCLVSIETFVWNFEVYGAWCLSSPFSGLIRGVTFPVHRFFPVSSLQVCLPFMVRTQVYLKSSGTPPPPVVQPLPKEDSAALVWLFFLYMPPLLRSLGRATFLAQVCVAVVWLPFLYTPPILRSVGRATFLAQICVAFVWLSLTVHAAYLEVLWPCGVFRTGSLCWCVAVILARVTPLEILRA
jgi:hypothetical protein